MVTQYFPTSEQPWAGHSAYQTLRLLARRCDLKVFYPEGRYPSLLTPASRIFDKLDGTYQPDDVDVEYLPHWVVPVLSRPLNGWLIALALRTRVQAFRPDIILSYVIYPDGFAAVRIGKSLGIPVVLTAIGSDLNRISDPLCGALTRSALHKADGVITVSGDLLKTARRLGADAASSLSILNGCDTSIFYPHDRTAARKALELAPETDVVVYVGRLDVRKGLLELIDAAAELQQRRPQLQCYIVGEGPDKPLLAAAAKKHNAHAWLTFVPSCTTERVAQWMAAADLITLPSYKEGCPNVIIEALASGRPVVATNVGGIPELMDSTSGRLVPPKDVSALATAFEETLSVQWNAQVLSERHARSWEAVADRVHQVLTETLNRPSF